MTCLFCVPRLTLDRRRDTVSFRETSSGSDSAVAHVGHVHVPRSGRERAGQEPLYGGAMGERADQRPEAVGATGDGEAEAGASYAAPARREPALRFAIPVKTISESNRRCHWSERAKRVSAQRKAAGIYTYQAAMWTAGFRCLPKQVIGRSPTGRLTIHMTRVSPGILDDDNLRSALKGVRDGIATSLGVDDGHDSLRWEYAQRRGKQEEYAVEVVITPRLA